MKARTQEFKNAMKGVKEIDAIITYTINNVEYELSSEQLNSIQPHYEGAILKSVMKELDLDSNVEIPNETIINLQFGVKVRYDDYDEDTPGAYRINYDYINFGNYVVYSSEKQEDTNSYLIKCYDKMIYSMKDYESIGVTYPITIQNYLNAICTHLGLTLKSSGFTNYDKEISNELYLDENGNSIGYTFRDVLDEIAQVTASTICINENDDELEVRYITDTNDTIDEEFFDETNVNFGEVYGPINTVILSRSAESDEIAQSIPSDLSDDEKIAIKISENQILNFDNREEYLDDILNTLYGLTYTQNDYSSKGICYYDLCDRYTCSIFDTTYNCVMLNDDIIIESALSENISTEIPENAETDYSKTSESDKTVRRTTLIVDKQIGEIRGVVEGIDDEVNGDNGLATRMTRAETTLNSQQAKLAFINEDGSVQKVRTETDFTFDAEGLRIGKSTDDYNSLQDNTGTYYYEKDTMTGKYTKDGSVQKNLALYGKYYYGIDEEEVNVAEFERSSALFLGQLYEKEVDGVTEKVFGHFWNGS